MNELNQVVFSNIDEQESWTIDSYIASGGYEAWKNILSNKDDSHKPVSYTHLTLPTKA